MCLCAEYFLFAAVPVVQGGRPAAGRGPVRRDHQRPGRDQTLRRLWDGVYAQLQPGQILPGLRGAGTPEERGGTPAEKIPPVYAFRVVKVHGNQGFFRMVGRRWIKLSCSPQNGVLNAGKWTKKNRRPQRQYSPCARHFSTQYLNNILFGIKFITIANYCFYILMSLAIWF